MTSELLRGALRQAGHMTLSLGDVLHRALGFIALYALSALLLSGCHSKIEGVRLELLASITIDENGLDDAMGREVTLDELVLGVEMVELIACEPGAVSRVLGMLRPTRALAYHGGPATPTTYAHHTTLDLLRQGERAFGDASDAESDTGFSPPANRYCAVFLRLGEFTARGFVSEERLEISIDSLRLDLFLELDEPGVLDEVHPNAELLYHLDVGALIRHLELRSALSEVAHRRELDEGIRKNSSVRWREPDVNAP